jgi:hypothetical protein
MVNSAFESLRVGIWRRSTAGITQALSAAGAVWLITEIATKVSDPLDQWIKQHGTIYTAIVLVAAAI